MDVDPQPRARGSQLPTPSPFVQCSNCRNANFPCETRARLSKQATPRSYIQYLEARVRHLEGQRETEWSPQGSSTRHSPYGESNFRNNHSPEASKHPKRDALPDWTVLKELGTHVIDEDGFSRYMGPSSGVGFSAKVLQDILDEDQPPDPEFYSLFSLDDLMSGKALEDADTLLWQIVPTELPPRHTADAVLRDFFNFTERVFPVLHRPSFMTVVDQLYDLDIIDSQWFEVLSQFWFAISIGYHFNRRIDKEQRINNQIRALQSGCRSYFTTLHARRDGLTRLQSLTLQAYALTLLRQRSEALKISAIANTKALECGLHHDGKQFTGNPLETEMRRRIFWCIFMLHLFNSSLAGLPRALHEADITIADPSDIDDEQLTTTEVLNFVPGRTRIHRFVSVCRLVRILSRALDILYTHNKRKHASTRIEQMNRLCCEHLLDQLNFSFEETPDDMPEPDSEDPADMAILASYANEQLLYHYIRWLIHRPGLSLAQTDPQFASCLQTSTEAATSICHVSNIYKLVCPFIIANPAAHPCTLFIAALTPLHRVSLLRAQPGNLQALGYSAEDDLQACQQALSAMAFHSHDHADIVRRRVLQGLVTKMFSEDHEELRRLESIKSNIETSGPVSGSGSVSTSGNGGRSTHSQDVAVNQRFDFHEQQFEHYTAHQDLRDFVHEAFSPNMGDMWPSDH